MHSFVALEKLYGVGDTREKAHFNFMDEIFQKDGKTSKNSVSSLFDHFLMMWPIFLID